MASAKLFGCSINDGGGGNDEAVGGVGGGNSISVEVSRPDSEAMSMFPPFNYFDSNLYSRSASMESKLDLRNCFIDFFDQESYDMETVEELSIWETKEGIELGLGIGSGSGSILGELHGGDSDELGLEVTGNREVDSGRVEFDTPICEEEATVVDEELQWEDLQNAITWVQEPVEEVSPEEEEEEEEEESSLASRDDDDQDWEVLFPLNNVNIIEESVDIMVEETGLVDLEDDFLLDGAIDVDYDGDYYDDDIGQMFDNVSGIMGSPPASKTVVDNLPVVEFTSNELSDGNNIVCAICKDEIVVEEKVKRLPCRHYYHGDCIIPWLGIRNTCPLCRYELPTDNFDYERSRRSQRPGNSGVGSEFISE